MKLGKAKTSILIILIGIMLLLPIIVYSRNNPDILGFIIPGNETPENTNETNQTDEKLQNIKPIAIDTSNLNIEVKPELIEQPSLLRGGSIGYEYLDNETIRIWNQYYDYYINGSSGIQLTNHYDQFWPKNLFCAAIRNANWNYYCVDSLPIRLIPSSDFETYVNLTGNFSIGNIDFFLTYHLESDDQELTVKPKLKNRGNQQTLNDIGFGWKVQDIQINMVEEDNYVAIDSDYYDLHNDSLNEVYTDLSSTQYSIHGENDNNTGEWLRLRWENTENFELKVKSEQRQYNAPITIILNQGRINANEEREAIFYWIDAGCQFNYQNPTPNDHSNVTDTTTLTGYSNNQCNKPAGEGGYIGCKLFRQYNNGSFVNVQSTGSPGSDCVDSVNDIEYSQKLPFDTNVSFRAASYSCCLSGLGCGEFSYCNKQSEWNYRNLTQVANESEARTAIVNGILNITPNATIYTDQQIYTTNINQTKGKFDKVSILNNQTWAFNYILNEAFTNVLSIGTIVNIWEKANMTPSKIELDVEAFINSTLQ